MFDDRKGRKFCDLKSCLRPGVATARKCVSTLDDCYIESVQLLWTVENIVKHLILIHS